LLHHEDLRRTAINEFLRKLTLTRHDFQQKLRK